MGVEVEPRGVDSGGGSETVLPRAFGKYVLFDHIGRGGMANIFLARMVTELGASRRVVVKEILPEYSAHARFTSAFVSEAKLASQLSHHNIVRVLDLGREEGRLFIAMEYVEGFDMNRLLAQLSKRRLPLPAEFAFFVVREVLSALDYAHRATDAQGSPLAVVHRDVSPSNVLISFEGEVRLCDFGIARAFSTEPGALSSGPEPPEEDPSGSRIQRVRLVGKCAYMAPEHARGAEIDARSDVFAVGILLWELCAGRRLYRGDDQEVLEQARSARIPPLPERGLPEAERLRGILARALSPDPAMRYQSARQLLVELENYALSAQLMASQLRFAAFLRENFADAILALRAGREQAAEAALHAHALRRAAEARQSSKPPPPSRDPVDLALVKAAAALDAGPTLELAPMLEPDSEPEAGPDDVAEAGALRPSLPRTLALAVGFALALAALLYLVNR